MTGPPARPESLPPIRKDDAVDVGTQLPTRFVLVVSGHPGAGKTSLAPVLAERLHAVCISREEISNLIFDGWEPEHPAMSASSYASPTVAGNVYIEGKVSWSIFLSMIERTARVSRVVAESPFNDEFVRRRFLAACPGFGVPIAEVTLTAELGELERRVQRRADAPAAHPIKSRFTVPGARELLATDFVPVLPLDAVLSADTSDFGALDIDELVSRVAVLLSRVAERAAT